MTQHPWIGVDISKKNLDVFTPALGERRFGNSAEGHQHFVEAIQGLPIGGIVMEATGGYERALLAALTAKGLPAAVVNPARVRAFAIGTGQLAKTDRLDARILAGFGAFQKPAPTPLPSSARAKLKELLAYRSQLVAEIVARKAQLRGYAGEVMKKRAESAISERAAECKAIDAEIKTLIKAEAALAKPFTILTSVPSIGLIVAATLIAELPELGMLSRRRIASLAGLAPFPRESGTHRGYRAIRGGRAEVRHALFNAARVALRFNPVIKVFADRLTACGKPYKVVVVAAMRKLLTILNVMLRTATNWRTAQAS